MSPRPDDHRYPDVDSQPDFPKIEEEILAFWAEDETFEASIDNREGAPEYVFYDGPPFANGLPHYGHLLTGFVKDTVPRYQTMRGKRVERRFGWDTHGLPAEMATEKELGVSGHVQIEEYGIAKFNEACRTSVLRYTNEWQTYVTRMARWVDFENDYKTLDLTYMESVLWAFKQLWEKGLIYEGHRVVAFCWECETPLSNFETKLDDAYRDRTDPALTVLFELEPEKGEPKTSLLAWTTTPWTLPSNLGLAVGAELDYAIFEEGNERYILAESRVEAYEKQLENAQQVGAIKGVDLVGRQFKPLFPFFADHPNVFKVMDGSAFVTTESGTGVVHIAPGFGEDDQKLCEANGIAVVVPVDEQGKFTAEVPPYEGVQVFDANDVIIKDLKDQGKIVKREGYMHSYPHCWRTDTPLIYKAVGSWYVEVTAIKDRLLELNENINWIPGHVKHGVFGKWLENVRDWSISRNRFWGSPIPVWKSDNPEFPRLDVYGSLDEIERDFGVRPDDLHRPGIDELTRPNPDDPSGQSTMRRVEEVLDCWFESGSMPYAQVHYPMDNVEHFEQNFPADFIVEYVAQTRAWFYNLHVLSTALFDSHPFKNCVTHGNVLGDDGRKMSKRYGNFPDPVDVFDKQGADAIRWFLLASPVLKGQDVVADRKYIIEGMRQVITPLWNAYYFFTLYANTDGITAQFRTDATGELDRYILAKTQQLHEDVTGRMDAYDIPGACSAVFAYVDALNNWFIRRSRPRIWKTEIDQDKQDAYDTLYTVLVSLSQISAPLLPLITEAVYKGLTDERSVHLTDWMPVDTLPTDQKLVHAMDRVREVASAGLSIRKAQGRRVRLPLSTLTVAAANVEELRPFIDLIADEVNVKNVVLTDDTEAVGDMVLKLNPPLLGPKLGKDTPKVMAAVREGRWEQHGEDVVVEGHTLSGEEFSLKLEPRDSDASRSLSGANGCVVLDVQTTPELEAEGLARDVVRLVQNARRDAGLHVSDRIKLVLDVPESVQAAVTAHQDYVAEQVLATDLSFGAAPADLTQSQAELEGQKVTVALAKA